MVYIPTTWVDGQAPAINAANLNKIEQGIVDAHAASGDLLLDTKAKTSNQSNITSITDITDLSSTVNVVAGERYRIEVHTRSFATKNTSGAGYVRGLLTLTDANNNILGVVADSEGYASGTGVVGGSQASTAVIEYTAAATESFTFKVRGQSVGTDALLTVVGSATGPSTLRIYKIGSALGFDQTGIAGAFTRVDAPGESGFVTWTEWNNVLSLVHTGGDATSEYHGFVKAHALAVGDYVETHVRMLATGALPVAGLVVSDGTTFGAGTQLLAIHYYDGSAWKVDLRSTTLWNTLGTSGTGQGGWGTTPPLTPHGGPLHIRILRSASTTWQLYLSLDAVGWLKVSELGLSLTPTHIGLVTSSYNTTLDFVASFSYLRLGTA